MTFRHTKYAAYIGYITQAIVNNLVPLLFVSFSSEFSLGLEQISLLIVVNFGVQIATDIIAAGCVDKIGYRKACVAAHIFVVAGLVGLGTLPFILPSYVGLIVSSAISAVGGGLCEVVISPVVEALPGDEKASAMSMLHSFYCWGQVLVVLCSTLYFTVFGIGNWRILPFIWAAVPFFNIFFFAKVPIRTLNEQGESMKLRELFGSGAFRLFLLLMLCSGASELSMSQWSSFFAEAGLGVDKAIGDLAGPCAFAALMGTARTIYGVRGHKMNLRYFILGSGMLCTVSYLISVFAPNPVLSLIGCASSGFAVGIMWPGTYSLASARFPGGGTAMFAVLALAGDFGCSAGPAITGIVADNFGGDLKNGLLAAAIFPLIMAVGVIFTKKENPAGK